MVDKILKSNPLFSNEIKPVSAAPAPMFSPSPAPGQTKEKDALLLIVDWSNIFYRSMFMYSMFNPMAGDYTRQEDLQSFGYKLCQDVLAIYNIFRPQHFMLAADGKDAWRKEIIPGEYKSTRQKDENVDWEALYKVSDEIQEILADKMGAMIATTKHAEADDIIAMTKECVWGKPENTDIIIVSADADLRQLIEFNQQSRQFCIVYNTTTRAKSKTRRLYIPENFQTWLSDNEVDLFFSNFDPVKNNINQILQNNSMIEPFVENPNEIVLSKIFCGDDSDHVPSSYSWFKGSKAARITPAKYKKITEMLGITNVKTLNENIGNLAAAVEKVCKVVPNDVDFNERIMRQRRLVELNSELFPEEIREYKETIGCMLKSNVAKVDTSVQIKVADILKGTKYETGNQKKTLEASVFKEFEKMNSVKASHQKVDINNFDVNTLI